MSLLLLPEVGVQRLLSLNTQLAGSVPSRLSSSRQAPRRSVAEGHGQEQPGPPPRAGSGAAGEEVALDVVPAARRSIPVVPPGPRGPPPWAGLPGERLPDYGLAAGAAGGGEMAVSTGSSGKWQAAR